MINLMQSKSITIEREAIHESPKRVGTAVLLIIKILRLVWIDSGPPKIQLSSLLPKFLQVESSKIQKPTQIFIDFRFKKH